MGQRQWHRARNSAGCYDSRGDGRVCFVRGMVFAATLPHPVLFGGDCPPRSGYRGMLTVTICPRFFRFLANHAVLVMSPGVNVLIARHRKRLQPVGGGARVSWKKWREKKHSIMFPHGTVKDNQQRRRVTPVKKR